MSTANAPDPSAEREQFVGNVLEASIRVGLIALVVFASIAIMRPFIAPLVWGMVIAIATNGLYLRLESLVGGRSKLAAVIFSLAGLGLIIGPALALAGSIAGGVEEVAAVVGTGEFKVPPPPEQVSRWPVVGSSVSSFWSLASTNLEAALKTVDSQLASAALWLLNGLASAGLGVLLFAVSIVIAAIFHTTAETSGRAALALTSRVAGERGPAIAALVISTIRGVARGVLGVALIQALAGGLGMLVVGVPAAGVWTILILLMAVMQLPTLLLLLPIAFYVFSYATPLVGGLFFVWAVLVSLSDNVLKPLLLSRGVEVPMLVVLVGALGGFASIGLIGLFIGPIVVAVAYQLLTAWIDPEGVAAELPEATERPEAAQ